MRRNIGIAYVLAFCRYAWFWLGIWVFYYLRITNYAGIGLVEAVMILSATSWEIPTGAIADILGRKKVLLIALTIQAISYLLLSFVPNLLWLVITIFILGIGGAFYSGTIDALIYDSLKEIGDEKLFDKVISRITSIGLIAPAVCGIIGGFLYAQHPNLPYLLDAFILLMGIPFCLFITEPHIKEKATFSFANFIQQTKYGFHSLFISKTLAQQSILLLGIGAVSVICVETMNDFLGINFGFTPTGMAILFSVLYVVCSFASHITPAITKFISYKRLAIFIGIVIAAMLLISPFIKIGGLLLGAICLLFLTSAQTIYTNVASVLINESTQSKYRTTTLSTFSLIKNIPYLILAYFLGSLVDQFSAVRVAFVMGAVLLLFVIAISFIVLKSKQVAGIPALSQS